MNKIKDNNLYLKVLKFGEAHPEGFTYKQINMAINPQDWEDKIIKRYMYNAILNGMVGNNVLHESIFLDSRIDDTVSITYGKNTLENNDSMFSSDLERITTIVKKATFIIKYDAFFNYIDYLELQKAIENSNEANKHAEEAKNLALWAIWMAVIVGIIQIIIDIIK